MEGRHREDRRRIRRRTGRHATSDQIERVGERLALWSNARNPWFIQHVLEGVDLRRVFMAQDAARVEAGVMALRAKHWRGRLPVRARDRHVGALDDGEGQALAATLDIIQVNLRVAKAGAKPIPDMLADAIEA